jgi:hypothetical protein
MTVTLCGCQLPPPRRVINSPSMAKDTRLSFRVRSDLKETLEGIAAAEGRSVAQVCEAFLKIGSENYKREGNKLLQRSLAKPHNKAKIE